MSSSGNQHKNPRGQNTPGPDKNRQSVAANAVMPVTFSPAAVSENQKRTVHRLAVLVGITASLAAGSLIAVWISRREWQFITLAILFASCAIACGITFLRLNHHGNLSRNVAAISIFLGLAMLGAAALGADLGIFAAVLYIIFTLLISSAAPDERQANLALGLGIFVASASALLTSFSPFPQVAIQSLGYFVPVVLVGLTLVCSVLLVRQLRQSNLRSRLVTVFLAIVIIPLAILSVIQSQFMFQTLNREISQGLILAAGQATAGIDKFLSDTEKSVQEAASLDIFNRYLSLPESQRKGSPEEQEMRLTLNVLDTSESNSTIYLSSFALLNNQGINVYDSLKDRIAHQIPSEALQGMGVDLQDLLPGEGTNESAQDYFRVPLQRGLAYISPVQVASSTRGFFYISAPIKNQKDEVVGVLRARYDGLLLQDLLKQYNGLLTAKSYAILVDENNIRLADAFTPNFIYKSIAPLPAEKVSTLQKSQRLANLPAGMVSTGYTEFDQILNNYEKQAVFTTTHSLVYNDNQHSEMGAIARLRTMPWRVVYLRADYSDAEVRRSQLQITTLITVILAGLAALAAVFASQWLSRPINRLTQTAQSITNGDLNAQAPIQSADEFGVLAAAFNHMTGQMRDLINQLEERVKARTQEIEQKNEILTDRASQLQTVAEVARQIVSAQELDRLLTSVTQLVSERFGFYHVGIFLLDEPRQYAVLRAANSAGGKRMLERQHMLPVGKVGIVGNVTGEGKARIATDVGEDAIYFNNPDLPDTRSEMALPLKVGEQVIGALDIQSTESNAFRQDDIDLFNTLADQIAIAIYNNQLYTATRRALDEAQTLHRQYLQSEWAQDTTHRKTLGYLYNQFGISAQAAESPLWEEVLSTGQTICAQLPAQQAGQEKDVMAVPIALRGQTIGVIQVQQGQGDERGWSEDEIAVVNNIASQVAIALENARLFENTLRRADREKKVLQITEKIRATNDPNEMLQVAIRELQQALKASRAQIYIRPGSDEPAQALDGDHHNGAVSHPPENSSSD